MTIDNWHKRFGKMWLAIAIILFFLIIEIEFRCMVNDKIFNTIEDVFSEQNKIKQWINLNHKVNALMIDYLLSSPQERNTFRKSFNLDLHINQKVLYAFTNEEYK